MASEGLEGGATEMNSAGSPNPLLLSTIRWINRLGRLVDYRLGCAGVRSAAQCRIDLRLRAMLTAGDHQGAAEYLRAQLDFARPCKRRLRRSPADEGA